jgi:hypothetical protein
MKKDQREFIIKELMMPDFIENCSHKMLLEEREESGRSELNVRLLSGENLCIANADKKKTDIHFFQNEKIKSMYKRVDHIIFEHEDSGRWKLHLIEMKGSVGEGKWIEIKGKFRASYLLSKAVSGMLELDISETLMYTTFEKVQFHPPDTMPAARRTRPGKAMVKMEHEWNSKNFGLNFGERVLFKHIPIQMIRNKEGILTGNLIEAGSALE